MPSLARHALACFALLSVPGCILDRDAPCGIDQELDDSGSCACIDGTELDDDGHRCVEAEVVPAGLGEDCSDAPCGGEAFPRCQATAAGDYCTSEGCDSNADCTADYACNARGETSYCQRPPLGQGTSCTASEDCAGGEATYCETTISNQCLVPGCSEGTCFEGYACCDVRSLGAEDTYCVPEGQCPV